MSATLDVAARCRRFSTAVRSSTCRAGCIRSTIAYAPGQSVADAAADVLAATARATCCAFCRRRRDPPRDRRPPAQLAGRRRRRSSRCTDRSTPTSRISRCARRHVRRRIIVATNIAETSLTVPGVTAVVDTGLHKVARYDAERGIDSLETERITADAADQRAGRAGRVAPGVVRRLWDARDRLRPHREPEIHRVDLSSAVLDVIAWGGDPRTLEWFERPRDDALDAALTLLARLGSSTPSHQAAPQIRTAIRQGSTARAARSADAVGEQVRRLPLHPRLARMLVAAGGAAQIAQACALLSERHLPAAAHGDDDVRSAVGDRRLAARCRRTCSAWRSQIGLRIARLRIANQRHAAIRNPHSACRRPHFRRAILAGYPDRVAQRREPGSPNVLLASGTGATIAPESGVRDGEFLVALDVHARAGPQPQPASIRDRRSPQSGGSAVRATPVIRIASRVEREWLTPTASEVVHRFDKDERRKVRAVAVDRYDALVLAEHPVAVDPEIAARAARRRLARARSARRRRAAAAAAALRRARRRSRRAGPHRRLRRRARSTTCGSTRACRRRAARRSIATRPTRSPCRAAATCRLEYDDDGTRVGVGQAAGGVRPRRDAAHRPRGASRCCSRCSRRTAGRCRSRATCAASGIGRIRRCGRNCAAATRSIRGPRIRGRRRRRRARPNAAYVADEL